ncbi:quercetin dioxygenase-like cupin family protein [Polynucleobacter sphagniphilus]|nr:quercetin dioxygenase-like cupin family protein [Polynucleobacter sphagniphilus]
MNLVSKVHNENDMKVFKLEEMTKGWFVGNFTPTVLLTNQVEVAVKKYKAGEYESSHHHKIATEITVITDGEVKMNDVIYKSGTILVIEPNTPTDFLAITDVTTTVVKFPGASDDKYLGEPNA